MKNVDKIRFAVSVCWVVLLAVFAAVLFTSQDWARDKFLMTLMGPGGVLLGLVGGGILFGVAYQNQRIRPGIKEIGMLAVAGLALCVAAANLVWGFAHSMPFFDVALGLGFSGAGLLWLRWGVAKKWGRADEGGGAVKS